jgi:hypothetical protein
MRPHPKILMNIVYGRTDLACTPLARYAIIITDRSKGRCTPLFVITDQARKYINRKGNHIRISLETFLTCNRSCRAPQGINRQPVVQLGQPLPEQREFFKPVELDGITLWYEPNNIVQDDPHEPIRISVKQTLFVYELQVHGVKAHP